MKTTVLGIDPGTTRIGYGLIGVSGMDLRHIESGLLPVPASERRPEARLLNIEHEFEELVRRTNPGIVGIEKLFFTKNKKTAMRVAEARGVILKAAAGLGLRIEEVSPSAVKIAVTGDGRAGKEAVAKMTNLMLKLPPRKVVDDVTDALAIAIAVSNTRF
ncbi:crossover junction endodeoxyribonuclease RuvC [Patescibacteria group bacterium]|nr:crossover junction endodeoxyribonuclease RuvC [Patescibacteria group bacterium]